MIALLLSLPAFADCPVRQVLTEGFDVVRPFADGAIPRGSLVLPGSDTCDSGDRAVSVVSVNWRYNDGKDHYPARGDLGCLPEEALGTADQYLAFSPHPDAPTPPPVAPGTVVSGDDCEPEKMANLRPISGAQLSAIQRVQAAHEALWGPIGLDRIGYSDWGYVSLPFTSFRSTEALEAARDAEKTVTPKQRELVTDSFGPQVESLGHAYEHWPGADPRWVDTWGEPDTIIALMRAAAGWYTHCAASTDIADASPVNCTVQYGDIAWYNPRRPDPLGHNTHADGKCVDIRLFRKDGSRYEAWYNKPDDRDGFGEQYSPSLNRAFAGYLLEHAPVARLYFNDPAVREAFPRVEEVVKHDDHMHWCVP